MAKPELKIYKKLCVEFYDLELESRPDADLVISFYMDYAIRAKGLILEPMCGSGRFLLPMLQAGLAVEGFDASEHMLDALKKKYALCSKFIPPVWQQFVQDFSSQKKYRLIFIPFGSLGLVINREEVKKSLALMYEHLEFAGTLVLEIETVTSVQDPINEWRRGVQTRTDGSKILLHLLSSYDKTTQMFTSLCRYESIRNNAIENIEIEEFQQYLYQVDEMDNLLRQAGFIHIKKYSNYQKDPYVDQHSSIIIYECIK